MDGIISINKEKGYTSHDVVARMRGILKQKKIGHTGTLDPDATGVLPVCIGAATKLCDLFTDQSKTYEAVLHLGIETDTEDMTGTVLHTDASWENLEETRIRETVMSFVGPYAQIPPMYSALKVRGRKLYEYARKGIEVERAPRMVQIFAIEDIRIEMPLVRMRVSCSKGTYIRTLCADIGKKLGCGGCMQELVRIRVGGFRLENSVTLEELEQIVEEERLSEVLKPVDDVFLPLPAGVITEAGEKYLFNGNAFRADCIQLSSGGSDEPLAVAGEYSHTVRVYDREKHFIGLYDFDEEEQCYKPRKLFFAGTAGGRR